MRKSIEKCFKSYGVMIQLIKLKPTYETRRKFYIVKFLKGTRIEKLYNCIHDVKLALQLPLFEVVELIDGILLIVSESSDIENSLLKVINSSCFTDSNMKLPVALGYDYMELPYVADLSEIPHALYTGATGSGKSHALISMIVSLIVYNPPSVLNLVIIDMGSNSMNPFDDIPHLSHPVVRERKTACYVLEQLLKELKRRNTLSHDEMQYQPEIVCVIDEFLSLMDCGKDKATSDMIERLISSLLQRGRKARIHLILATHTAVINRMKVDISSITTRIAFKCAKYHDSISAINCSGAEKLRDKGDMLFCPADSPEKIHLQGTYISDDELLNVIDKINSAKYDLNGKFTIPEFYDESNMSFFTDNDTSLSGIDYVSREKDTNNKKLAEIILWALKQEKVSGNRISQFFHIGDSRAGNIIKQLENKGLVSGAVSKQPRNVLPTCIDDISEDVKQFLSNYYSETDIAEAFKQ